MRDIWLAKGARAVLVAAAALAVAGGAVRLARDPSFSRDEAAVAVSLRAWSAHGPLKPRASAQAETARWPLRRFLGGLAYGQQFPRFYLLLIALVQGLAGFSTLSARLLPFAAFAAASVCWLAYTTHRTRGSPAALLLAALLLLLPGEPWLMQAARLKQYSFDVLLALLPFLLEDSWFESAFAGERLAPRAAALLLPILFSYTYALPLAARAAAWLLARARQRVPASPALKRNVALWSAGAAGCFLALYVSDLRHAAFGREELNAFWGDSILPRQGVSGQLRVVGALLTGWYPSLPRPLAGLIALCQVAAAAALLGRARPGDSRLLGSALCLVFAAAASYLFSYPLAVGRITLYLLPHLQLLAVAGFALAYDRAAASPRLRAAAAAAFLALLGPGAARAYRQGVLAPAVGDIRPLLPRLDRAESSSVIVPRCSTAQVETLPEGFGGLSLSFLERAPAPPAGKSWVLIAHIGPRCEAERLALERSAARWTVVAETAGAQLVRAEFQRAGDKLTLK